MVFTALWPTSAYYIDRFRWVACQLDSLEKCLHVQELQEALASLPDTLDETYSRILTNINEHREDTIRILQLLAFSERPLTIKEAVDAMVVNPSGDPQFNPNLRLPTLREITKVCSSLVSLVTRRINRNRGEALMELQLTHFSVKEYLTSGRVEETFQKSIADISARGLITRVCLAYLSHLDEMRPIMEIKAAFPLAQYAARYWMNHAKPAETEMDVQESILKFFQQRQAYAVWGSLFNPDQPWDEEPWRHRNMATPLYYMALGGLRHTVKTLLDRGADVNAQGGKYGNALQAASWREDEKMVQILVENGADVNAQGGRYGNALQAASLRGHEKVVQVLLDKGANVKAQGSKYGNALYAALLGGHEKVVQMLLDKGADVELLLNADSEGYRRTPLWLAAAGEHEAVAKLLLEKGADPDSKDSYGWTALQFTAVTGHKAVVKLLLAKESVGPDSDDLNRRTPLLWAAERGHEVVVKPLLAKEGVNPDSKDPNGLTPLLWAAESGHEAVVKLLLAKEGVDLDLNRRTPLLWAATRGHEAVVKLLLAKEGVNLDSKDPNGRTPLSWAVEKGHKAVVKLLLEKGANPDSKGGYERTVLQFTAVTGNKAVVKLLLTKGGVDADSKNPNERTPLLWAVEGGHEAVVVKLLLAKEDVDLDPKDLNRRIPLSKAAWEGYEAVVKLLLAWDSVEADLKDEDGQIPH
jgi:ankyrin repeat protein